MNRKDYIILANALRGAKQDLEEYRQDDLYNDETMKEKVLTFNNVVASIELALKVNNENFDFQRFEEAINN